MELPAGLPLSQHFEVVLWLKHQANCLLLMDGVDDVDLVLKHFAEEPVTKAYAKSKRM